ncbi:vacuolar protein sorting-associated protein 13D isoform X2 [Nilaparvata lugens]|uniref:vacuolar protein sorting-associated protein 13D isoform X2 n=1 Tax=Nilaparvata lugens TaxID=108931 RepID=UPI00193E48C5|nr:vacuolar protein sorting-associated protein 13D isoform X2 [Nilaparvata lugens]
MLESLVAWVLNNYLGKYVENLNTDQLSIALLQGAVELENLPLRKDALRQIGMPVQVRSGLIGKVRLQIPVSQIRSAPWEISIEQLYVVIGPVHLSQWDEEAEENAAQDYKLSLLDAIEARWRAETESGQAPSYYASSYSSWLSYGTTLVTNIVENLQLKIKDVHIRYEDDQTIEGSVFAAGLRIESLTAQSCDESFTPKFICWESSGHSFKVVQLTNLAVYWDSCCRMEEGAKMWGDMTMQELMVAMGGENRDKHELLLTPVSGAAHIKRNRAEHALRSRNQPRIICDLLLEDVPITLSDKQYGQMVGCMKGLDRIERNRRYRKLRPAASVTDAPRQWWHYAVACLLCDSGAGAVRMERAGAARLEGMLQRARDNVQYVRIYGQLLAAGDVTALAPADKAIKDAVEWERGFDELRVLREIAMTRIRPPSTAKPSPPPDGGVKPPPEAETANNQQQQGRSVLVSWFPQWWGWQATPTAESGCGQESGQSLESGRGQEDTRESTPALAKGSTVLEEEILDALADSVENNTILRRDTVFGQFNFSLKKGSVHLCQVVADATNNVNRSSCMMELQFENVQMRLESRPRNSSLCFHISLGAVSLHDHLTPDSAFPILISPQNCESAPSGSRNLPPGLARLLQQQQNAGSNQQPLFQLIYEYKPFSSNFDYRLQVKSESLDIVYNADAAKWLLEFFTWPHQNMDPSFRMAARQGYNAMKQRTKKQLLRNWDNILQGHHNVRKSWDVELDISAPQIFLVEHFNDKNAILCVVDFGKLHFTNQNEEAKEKKNEQVEEEEDEAFQTPWSTPPGSEASISIGSPIMAKTLSSADLNSSFNELALHHRLYDKYLVELNDLQILVGRVKDNWKFAHVRGTSALHVLDRFNISLQLERRVVYTTDPQFPSLTLSGNLPKLIVHVNEQKIQALRTLFYVVSGRGLLSPFKSYDPSPMQERSDADSKNEGSDGEATDNNRSEASYSEHTHNGSARLLMLQFSIDQMALEVQSRGRSVAELQVSGVKTTFTKRPYDTSLTLSVHSLLLVDALQTFGPDFELLVASHKHVGMDSVSGSLRDSEPTSPVSPGSPDPLSPRLTAMHALNMAALNQPTSPHALNTALSSLCFDRAKSPLQSQPPKPLAPSNVDSEALITIEIVTVSANCPTNDNANEDLQIANIQFNNLDVIANQETIVELVGFVKRVFPPQKSTPRPPPLTALQTSAFSASLDEDRMFQSRAGLSSGGVSPTTAHAPMTANQGLAFPTSLPHNAPHPSPAPQVTTRTKLVFDFHRLNVLLMRAVPKDDVLIGRKIATATMTDAKIHADCGSKLMVEGSLGGLQVLDLTPESSLHQRILSLGHDPLTDPPPDPFAGMSADLYKSSYRAATPKKNSFSDRQAFSFHIKRSLLKSGTDGSCGPGGDVGGGGGDGGGGQEAEISVEMASVWYTHSPRLLFELQSCATDFKQYMAHLARTIGTAATEMAIGLVHARAEQLVHSLSMGGRLYGSSGDVTGGTPRRYRKSFSYSTEQVDSSLAPSRGGCSTPFSPGDSYSSRTRIRWRVHLDTPVVIMPRAPNSPAVMVAHLGHISLDNSFAPSSQAASPGWADSEDAADLDPAEVYSIEVRDMNLYTLNIKQRASELKISSNPSQLIRVEKLYSCMEAGKPVLHNTTIMLKVQRESAFAQEMRFRRQEDILLESGGITPTETDQKQIVSVTGSIVSSLKVSLSREQYEQLLETVMAINQVPKNADSCGRRNQELDHTLDFQRSGTLVDIEEDAELHTGVSTLSLDPTLRARMLLHSTNNSQEHLGEESSLALKVSFQLPLLTLELIADFGGGEQRLVDLSFMELFVQYEQMMAYERNIQMSLRSVLLEDLSKPKDSKHRCIMTSQCSNQGNSSIYNNFVSKSCPDLNNTLINDGNQCYEMRNSLPDHLEAETVLGAMPSNKTKHHYYSRISNTSTTSSTCQPNQIGGRKKSVYEASNDYPVTPPPSPRLTSSPRLYREDNLVHVNVVLRTPRNQSKNTSRTVVIDFNSLDVVVNVESWVVVLDFFGISSSDPANPKDMSQSNILQGASSLEQIYLEELDEQCSKNNVDVGMDSEFDIRVRSLTVILNQAQYEVARANMSHLSAVVTAVAGSGITDTTASVGSFSLLDLTPEHGRLYRERFVTDGLKMKMVKYQQSDTASRNNREFDVKLDLEMCSVLYVHTQRFIAELQTFFRHFSHLQQLLGSIRSSTAIPEETGPSMRLKLNLHAASPVIFLPQSSRSTQLLVVDLGKLTVSNQFLKAGSPGTISVSTDPSLQDIVVLDVLQIQLENMDLLTGEWSSENGQISLGSYYVQRDPSRSMLREKCGLQLQVERNLMSHRTHCVPDMSVKGTLSTLAATLSVDQYKLVKGVLSFNIGECLDDIHQQTGLDLNNCTQNIHYNQQGDEEGNVWPWTSIHLELLDVSVRLQPTPDFTLACVNFIRSYLNVESYSDHSQDIDLVSHEILIIDTRYQDEPVNRRSNVFSNILQPMRSGGTTPYNPSDSCSEYIQAQVHHRKRSDFSKFTVLLNNMRLMAIADWWESVRDFIMENPEMPPIPSTVPHSTTQPNNSLMFELKLNITDSEIVIVEDTSQWDTNAVILKSTTVISYKPLDNEKPVSCSLNHCEMFSCILGMEDETALSIIDPVTVSIEIVNRNSPTDGDFKVLKMQMMHLSLRLSYHDVRMFSQMLQSLPQQTSWAKKNVNKLSAKPANFLAQVSKLAALGFAREDCASALEQCQGQLDDAALWLVQHASASASDSQATRPNFYLEGTSGSADNTAASAAMSFSQIEVKTDCLSVCVIDDCMDADVPLLEMVLSSLVLKHDTLNGSGSANCQLAMDYYNRKLSGWEPFLEPWRSNVLWERAWSCSAINKHLMQLHITSPDILNLNITSTLIDLYSQVKDKWTDDYYNPKERYDVGGAKSVANSSPPGYRRRCPFVPFALLNDTGSRLWFSTLTAHSPTSEVGQEREQAASKPDSSWTLVEPGDTVPFTFEERGKQRHRNTHKLKSHKVRLCVDGWKPICPAVSVDRVGVYFRQASPDFAVEGVDLPQARVVLEVTLEGSARKLVTVRSALQITNQLTSRIEVKLDNADLHTGGRMHLVVEPTNTLSVPLAYAIAQMYVRPLEKSNSPNQYYAFSNQPIAWKSVSQPGEVVNKMHHCNSNRGPSFNLCAVIRREGYPVERPVFNDVFVQPAHSITLISPMTIVNLLPNELHFSVKGVCSGRIRPGDSAALHEVDTKLAVELLLHVENYPGLSALMLPGQNAQSNFTARLRLQDLSKRRLSLLAAVTYSITHGLRVTVSAPFWLVNKTALPLVFRQEGVVEETAGQYEEHELARMVAPLMFSFADQEASPTVVARIGTRVHKDAVSQWCNNFQLHPGVQVRRLRVSLRDNRPDLFYMIGIDIRPGRGRYHATHIVTLSAHYQIHNKSSHRIQFAQHCFATTVNDPGAQATYLQAVPDCFLAFHWPRLDRAQLLCLRLMDVAHCCWSGGFRIDANDSLHLAVRDQAGAIHFLRVEIVLQGATFFIVITDAHNMPAPIRIDNFSLVPVQFFQGKQNHVSAVRARSSMPYAWDEPTHPPVLTLVAPGGVSAQYNVNTIGEGTGLTYENFIYIAFTGTFKNVGDVVDQLDISCQQLVLDVPEGSDRVILSRKEQGARSQLWRMTGDGHLQHEGSSPPSSNSERIMVLDISGPAPQPTQYVALVLRRPDKRRVSTQTWRFTDDGRLCCAHNNMCVQAKDGFFGLRNDESEFPWQKWSEVVLGPPQPECFRTTEQGIPLEQAVSRHRLRPGSGFLKIKIDTDGPTRVVQIYDVKEKRTYSIAEEHDWVSVMGSGNLHQHSINSLSSSSIGEDVIANSAGNSSIREVQLTVGLPHGLGLSLISRQPPEELVFMQLTGIDFNAMWTPEIEMFNVTIKDIQVDNQLFEAQYPVLLYVTPSSRTTDPEEVARPAIQVTIEKTPQTKYSNADIFKHLVVRVKNLSLSIEERLALKLFDFAGYGGEEGNEDVNENEFEAQRMLAEATSINNKRYYFRCFKLILTQIRLSVMTSSKLGDRLLSIKRKLGFTLIKFEDAAVELEPYVKLHFFETAQFIVNSILKHYKNVLKWQAAKILGSVDFLGNPLGFINDFSEGMSGLIFEGSVGALVKNVTHGLSNSAAKVAETLGDGLGQAILDEQHEETRQRIRKAHSGSSSDHIVAGLKGLGFGLLGGVTSVVKQSYEGASNNGMQGFVSGFGKGLIGTVTKPVVGVLDLASEAASVLRDSSRSSTRISPGRKRLPRCVTSATGLLPLYNGKQSQGQQLLHMINEYRYDDEQFMAYEILRSGREDLRIIISSEMVRVFSCNSSSSNSCTVVIESHLSDLYHCQTESFNSGNVALHYIELAIRGSAVATSLMGGVDPVKRPRVRCDSEAIAQWVTQQVNYAKGMHVEQQQTLAKSSDNVAED